MQDIEQVKRELIKANKRAEQWQKIAMTAFQLAGGHIEGCRKGLCCNCGLAQADAIITSEKTEAKRKGNQ